MGLSASQARLLSITARLSDNELHSQQIANSKVRLADKTQEASREYIDSLSATKLMYTTYDAKGNATQMALTPAMIYEYSDLKNQYGISNTSGQLLVTSTDAKNFEASNSVNDFVQLYDVALTDNPKYDLALKTIYGQEYQNFYDVANNKPKDGLDNYNVYGGTKGWVNTWNDSMTQEQYDEWIKGNDWIGEYVGKASGTYDKLIDKLSQMPISPAAKPQEPVIPEFPDFKELATIYNNSACYGSVSLSNPDCIWHMEHNLCNLIWGSNGIGAQAGEITNSAGNITVTANLDKLDDNSITNGFGGSGKDAAEKLLAAFKDPEMAEYECVQELIQNLINLYCDVVNYLSKVRGDKLNGTLNSDVQAKTPAQLYSQWQQFYSDLEGLNAKAQAEYEEKIQPVRDKYEQDLKNYYNNLQQAVEWQNACNELYDKYMDELKNLPMPKIPDEDNPKTAWYVNLWHRMNGASDYKSHEGTIGTYYKQLDDKLLTNQDWLKFALEHGVITMEKVQYVDQADNETGLKTSKWQAAVYTSCIDIVTVDDEVAIARAEAEYTRKLNEIQAKDKKFDNDIKKLDTEHNALQTEYESVKSVVDKNVERSFKAFS